MGILVKGRECLNFDGDPDPNAGYCTSAPCGDWTGLYKLPDGSGHDVFSLEWAYGGGARPPVCRIRAGRPVRWDRTWYHVAGVFDRPPAPAAC